MGCFFTDPRKNIRPRNYMRLVNTRILPPLLRKLIEKQQSYRQKTLKKCQKYVKYVFFRILTPPPDPDSKSGSVTTRAVSIHKF